MTAKTRIRAKCPCAWAATRAAGNRTTPSYVAFTEEKRMVGDATKTRIAMNVERGL